MWIKLVLQISMCLAFACMHSRSTLCGSMKNNGREVWLTKLHIHWHIAQYNTNHNIDTIGFWITILAFFHSHSRAQLSSYAHFFNYKKRHPWMLFNRNLANAHKACSKHFTLFAAHWFCCHSNSYCFFLSSPLRHLVVVVLIRQRCWQECLKRYSHIPSQKKSSSIHIVSMTLIKFMCVCVSVVCLFSILF